MSRFHYCSPILSRSVQRLERQILQIDDRTGADLLHIYQRPRSPAARSAHKRSCLLFAFAFFSRNGRKVAWIPRVSSGSFARARPRGEDEERNFTSVSVPHLKGLPSFFSSRQEMVPAVPSFSFRLYLPFSPFLHFSCSP